MLSDDYGQYDDADEGPLKPGEIGTLMEDDGSSKPYNVQSSSGKSWWYRKLAIVKFEVVCIVVSLDNSVNDD
jgi:hypothetical protein